MARTHGRIKAEVWRPESDYRLLAMDTQWAYTMLISQPQINNCGVVPYVPTRWLKYACDLTLARLKKSLRELERERFIVFDESAGEVLVRTFIKHDKIEAQPFLVKSAKAQFEQLESVQIRVVLAEEYPDLFGKIQIPGQLSLSGKSPHQRRVLDCSSDVRLSCSCASSARRVPEQ